LKDISKSTRSTLLLPDSCIGSWTDIIKLGDGSYPTPSPATLNAERTIERRKSDRKSSRVSKEKLEEEWGIGEGSNNDDKKKKKKKKKNDN
jgi:hypothetical protein